MHSHHIWHEDPKTNQMIPCSTILADVRPEDEKQLNEIEWKKVKLAKSKYGAVPFAAGMQVYHRPTRQYLKLEKENKVDLSSSWDCSVVGAKASGPGEKMAAEPKDLTRQISLNIHL